MSSFGRNEVTYSRSHFPLTSIPVILSRTSVQHASCMRVTLTLTSSPFLGTPRAFARETTRARGTSLVLPTTRYVPSTTYVPTTRIQSSNQLLDRDIISPTFTALAALPTRLSNLPTGSTRISADQLCGWWWPSLGWLHRLVARTMLGRDQTPRPS